MKRLSIGVLTALLAAGLGLNAVASPSAHGSHGNIGPNVTAQTTMAPPPPNFGSPPSGQIPILYNDHHVYTKPDVLRHDRVLAALVRGNTILIPLRSMFEQMGATVSYNAATKTVTVSKAGAEVKVTVGKPEVVINGETRPLDVPPIIYHGIVLVPVRVISEGMGAYVQWVQDRHIVVVRYIVATPPPPPSPPPPPLTPAPVPTPSWTWNGLYMGLNAGGIVNHDPGFMVCENKLGARYARGCPYPAYGQMNAAGFMGGAQLGYNFQAGGFVIGPEFGYDGTTLTGNVNFNGTVVCRGVPRCFFQLALPNAMQGQFTASESMTSFQTERLRIGFTPSQTTLVYLTGGWAQAHWNLASNMTMSGYTSPASTTIDTYGWAGGLGGEWAIAPRLSMKVEGMIYTLRPEPYTLLGTLISPSGVPITDYSLGKDFYFRGGLARIGFDWRL